MYYINDNSMNLPPKFMINIADEFIHLSHAPITEAVIEIRAILESPWDEQHVSGVLKEKLPEYPSFVQQKAFKQEFQIGVLPMCPQNRPLVI
jgi:hypothetical protein